MENKYLLYGNKKDCNGCGACALVCPKKCIHMMEDEEGFLYPVIDEKECIHCNRCKNICSNYNMNEKLGKAYMAMNTSELDRQNSASGGMFIILAKYVINHGGVVCGAKYDENLIVKHDFAETIEQCKDFMGSKYARSKIDGIYVKIEQFLKNNRYVLFSGTPCQVAGLKTYLRKDYDKLITCDVICHANPSPKVFEKYKSELERNKNKKVTNIAFRSKENGWANSIPIIEYEDGQKEEESSFYDAFVTELFNRPSCHDCKFSSIKRVSDFTIGDLWGIEEIEPTWNDNKGISLLVVSTKKAEKIFLEIKQYMKIKEVDLDKAFSYNHNKNLPMNKNREKFFKKINKEDDVIKYMKKYIRGGIITRIKRKTKRALKKILQK